MTTKTMKQLELLNLCLIPTVLKLDNKSRVKPERELDDVIVSLDSGDYPVDFMALQTKTSIGGNPIILGRF